MNLKLNKRDVYYYGYTGCNLIRLQKLNDGYYFRCVKKSMFYWFLALNDNKNIFNATKLKLHKKRRYKNI